MSRSWTAPEGDTARDLEFVLEDANGPADMNGVTPHLYLRHRTTGAELDAAATVVNPSAPVGDPDRGRCRVPGALRAAWLSGEYDVELEALYSGGARDVWPTSEHAMVIIRPRRTNLP